MPGKELPLSMQTNQKIQAAFNAFDDYNSADPETELVDGKNTPRALVYGQRMSARLNQFDSNASEAVQLSARCQHVGRWEIARNTYAMDKKGYFQWRHAEKVHQCNIADKILRECEFDEVIIEKVKFLLMKKELQSNSDTKLLEDVICLVFIEFYLEEFAAKHDDEKVIDILQKTIKKMTPKAIDEISSLSLSDKIKLLIQKAT